MKSNALRIPECDLVARYRNVEATEDLIIPVHLVCNTPDEVLIANVKANSALPREWVGHKPAHSGKAVMCGSGPSLADNIAEIDELHRNGATIFAMNAAAGYLASKGIWADYQVIVDAREETRSLLGPAKHHLFASQVHPSLFAEKPEAVLFHVNFCEDFEDFVKLLPGHDGEYALVGSHGSVGNVALSLAYALGFRDLVCFGYDSSVRGDASHVLTQPINAGDPMAVVEYAGKSYICSYTMKSQADVFPRLAHELELLGVKIDVRGDGFLPDRWRGERAKTLEQRETDKYKAMWAHDAYRTRSPGHENVEKAVQALQIHIGDTLIDFGCGTGRATKAFVDGGVKAVGVDIAPNAVEEDIDFTEALLWDLPDQILYANAKWGFCCDVMEHIPTVRVDDVLRNIAASVTHGAFFAIDSDQDEMGVLIGAPLHMTVKPAKWWIEKLCEHFSLVSCPEPGLFVCFHQKVN